MLPWSSRSFFYVTSRKFSKYEEHDEMPWQVQVHPFMTPTHESITEFESQLAEGAAEFGGRNDGWGSMAQD
jgi:hypothetical protein